MGHYKKDAIGNNHYKKTIFMNEEYWIQMKREFYYFMNTTKWEEYMQFVGAIPGIDAIVFIIVVTVFHVQIVHVLQFYFPLKRWQPGSTVSNQNQHNLLCLRAQLCHLKILLLFKPIQSCPRD